MLKCGATYPHLSFPRQDTERPVPTNWHTLTSYRAGLRASLMSAEHKIAGESHQILSPSLSESILYRSKLKGISFYFFRNLTL